MVEIYPPRAVPIEGLQRCVHITVLLHGKVGDAQGAEVDINLHLAKDRADDAACSNLHTEMRFASSLEIAVVSSDK